MFCANRTALELALATEQADLASYRAEQTALSTERAAILERLQLLNVREVKLAELDREAQRLEGDYRRYAEKQEQARIEAALDRERISNVAVFQGATLDRDPVSPSLLMLLGAGSVLSVMAAIGLALTAETLDQSIKTPEEVEQELDVPELVSVTHVPRRRVDVPVTVDARARRRSGRRERRRGPVRARRARRTSQARGARRAGKPRRARGTLSARRPRGTLRARGTLRTSGTSRADDRTRVDPLVPIPGV